MKEAEAPVLVIDPHSEYDNGRAKEERYFERITLIGDEMYRMVKTMM